MTDTEAPARTAAEPPLSASHEDHGLQQALHYGFTREDWAAARRIEFMIFGRDWESQQDRQAAAYVEVMAACREARQSARAWQPIETAPRDGTVVWVYVASAHGLPAFQGACAYHPDAGWCADELRDVTHWMPLAEPPAQGIEARRAETASAPSRSDESPVAGGDAP